MIERDDVESISKELADGLRKIYGSRLRELILYGSWARGDAREESDIDFLVVLDGYEGFSKELDRIIEVSSELVLKYGVYVSTQPISFERYKEGREFFVENVRKEGRRIA